MINKQAYINAIYQDIEIVRGDTLSFNFQLQGLGGAVPTFTMTIKEHYDDATSVIQIASSDADPKPFRQVDYDSLTDTTTYVVRIKNELTNDLELTRYYYDLRAIINGNVLTLMRGRFTAVYDVT